MAELKTKRTEASVDEFLDGIADETRRRDCRALVALIRDATGLEPKMWGGSIVGFGSYHYKYPSGHEGDSCLTGVSPRKDALTVYLMGLQSVDSAVLQKLGKHKAGKGCLYIKKLDDVHLPTLKKMVKESVRSLKQKYG